MKTTEMEDLELELARLVKHQDSAVGIDLKRINYKIAQLQSRIAHTKRGR